MAEMSFELIGVSGETALVNETLSYELRRDIDAPCDGLSLSFISGKNLGEIKEVKAYCKDELIFYGLCDTQREERFNDGKRIFLYARSLAALLLDNEAVPGSFDSPTAGTMYLLNAKEYGFSFDMEDIACEGKYIVEKGCSCYAAVNRIVSAKTGKNMIATPDMRLVLPKGDNTKRLDSGRVISEEKIINRASLISRIDYKAAGDSLYLRHVKSETAEKLGIKRSEKINLSSLFDWQKEMRLKNVLRQSSRDYLSASITLDGAYGAELYSSVYYEGSGIEDLENYHVSSVCIGSRGRSEKTKIKLFKEIDLKERIYVD